MVVGPWGSFDGTNITFSNDASSRATASGGGCVEINAQMSGMPAPSARLPFCCTPLSLQ